MHNHDWELLVEVSRDTAVETQKVKKLLVNFPSFIVLSYKSAFFRSSLKLKGMNNGFVFFLLPQAFLVLH